MSINFNGADWLAIEGMLAELQFETYRRLANPTCLEAETQQLRGRALLIDQLLDLRNNPAGEDRPL